MDTSVGHTPAVVAAFRIADRGLTKKEIAKWSGLPVSRALEEALLGLEEDGKLIRSGGGNTEERFWLVNDS